MRPTPNEFRLSTDPSELDLDVVHNFLRASYWAENIPRAVIAKAIQNSLCFGVYEDRRQIGFARVISDYATFAYLALSGAQQRLRAVATVAAQLPASPVTVNFSLVTEQHAEV